MGNLPIHQAAEPPAATPSLSPPSARDTAADRAREPPATTPHLSPPTGTLGLPCSSVRDLQPCLLCPQLVLLP